MPSSGWRCGLTPNAMPHHPPESTRLRPLPYLPGLDGLRALAVLAVLLYHGEVRWIPGGFLGVDVFFVISGYLITALLLNEWEQRGRIDLAAFWLRRARRLLPALFALLLVTLTGAVLFWPEEVARLRVEALAAFAYVTNWHLIFSQQPYFEAVGRPSPLLHLWSLAVEEQFYLLWPPLLVLGLRFWRRGRVFLATLMAVAFSALLMALLYRPDADPSRVYYGTDTRAFALLVGAALAFLWMPWRRKRHLNPTEAALLNVLGMVAIADVIWFFVQFDQFQPFLYRGGFLLLALITAVLIAVVVHPQAMVVNKALELPLVRWLGQRSYSIYLWHWPVFMVTRPQLDLALTGLPLLLLRLVLTFSLAELSYRLVETPIRRGALGQAWSALRRARGSERYDLGARWLGAAMISAAFALILGRAVVVAQPPEQPAYLAVGSVHLASSDTQGTPTNVSVVPVPAPTNIPPAPTLVPTFAPIKNDEALLLSKRILLPPTRTPEPLGHVVAIGDSVMLGAAGHVITAIGDCEVDAAVSRHTSAVIEMLRWRRDAGLLGDVVVVHTGDNGPITVEQFDELMQVLVDVRRVVIVNVKVPRFWQDPNNTILNEGVRRYPNAVLADWYGASIDHPEYFYDDGIHLVGAGAEAYANLVASAVKAP